MDVEDLFRDHGAAHQRAQILAEVGDDGDHRIAQHMTQHDGLVAHALGARSAHVILGDVGGDLGTGQSDDVGHGNGAEHHRRHQQVEESRIGTCGDRQDAPFHAEEILAEEAGDERWHGDQQQRDDQDHGIVPLALLQAGDHAEHHAEDGFEHERHQAKLDGDREGACDLAEHRLAGERLAEVERQRVLQEQEILDDERLVEVVLGANLHFHGMVDGLVSEHGLDRVSRKSKDKSVYQQGSAENHWNHLQNAAQKIFAHFLVAPFFIFRLAASPYWLTKEVLPESNTP